MDISAVQEELVLPGSQRAGVACSNGTYAAFAQSDQILALYLPNVKLEPIVLVSSLQSSTITAACIGVGRLGTSDPSQHGNQLPQTLLCCASRDALVVWVLEDAYAAAADQQPLPVSLQLCAAPGVVEAMALQQDGGLLAVGMDCCVGIWDLEAVEMVYRLDGHLAPVTSVCFNMHCPGQLITAAEDRTFKVWDLQQGSLVYQSSVLCAALPSSLSIDPSFPRMALGACDGTVRFFDLSALPAGGCRCLQVLDVAKAMEKVATAAAQSEVTAAAASKARMGPRVISSTPAWQQQLQATAEAAAACSISDDGDRQACSPSGSVITLHYSELIGATAAPDGSSSGAAAGCSDLLGQHPRLLVGTPRGIAVVGSHTYDVLQGHFFAPALAPQPVSSRAQSSLARAYGTLRGVHTAGAYCFGLAPDDSQLYCCVASAFTPAVSFYSLVPQANDAVAAAAAEDGAGVECGTEQAPTQVLSVFQMRPLPAGSPMKVALSACSQSSPSTSHSSTTSTTRLTSGSSAAGSSIKCSAWVKQSPAAATASAKAGCNGTSSKKPASASRPKAPAVRGAGKLPPADLPVTFHKKVKSSGYGFIQPPAKLGRSKPAAIKVGRPPVPKNGLGKQVTSMQRYPMDSEAPSRHQPDHGLPDNAPVHNAAVLCLAFSGDATRLLTASADRTARCMRLPLWKHQGKGTGFIGHSGAVTDVCWSHDGAYVLTTAGDRSARLWGSAQASPLLAFTHVQHQASSSSGRASSEGAMETAESSRKRSKGPPNVQYVGDVAAARFFYLDQFVLLLVGNKLHLYRYNIVDGCDDDIQRLRNNNTYSLAGSAAAASAQSLTDVACANGFLSTLALTTTSNRCVEVFDLAAMQVVRTFEDVHSRAPHTIAMPASSPYAAHAKEAFELFATSAPDHAVKLWDVRSERCMRCFTGHRNCQVRTGVAFSPCMRFLATGSEDNAAHIYDIRMGTTLARNRCSDTVADVAFNPLHPRLAAACMDGRVHMFNSNGASSSSNDRVLA